MPPAAPLDHGHPRAIQDHKPIARLLSVDVLRGATVALMVLVNSPGDPAVVFPQLRHADWNGWTLADLVFPNFLFLVGASSVFSTQAGLFKGVPRRTLALRLLSRSGRLFALHLLLTALPSHHLAWPDLRHLRIYGVLTRIALCSLVVGGLCLLTASIPVLVVAAAALLTGYWALLCLVPVPGHGRPLRDLPLLDPHRNLAAHLDQRLTALLQRTLRIGSLYAHTHDPEGLLSTLPALANTPIGAVAVLWLRSHTRSPAYRRNVLLLAGALLAIAGRLANRRLPINKNLWTSSFALLSGGISLLALALLYHAADVQRFHKRSHLLRILDWPWLVLGSNAIIAYALSVVLGKTLSLHPAGSSDSLRASTYGAVFARGRSNPARSLAYAATFAAICFLPNLFLWRKRIFIKI